MINLDTRGGLIKRLCDIEWALYDKLNSAGGQPSDQEDAVFFKKMRACQLESWSRQLLDSYRGDLERAVAEQRNPLWEKYAFMTEKAQPEQFAKVSKYLPQVNEEALSLIAEICDVQMAWEKEVNAQYPRMRAQVNPAASDDAASASSSSRNYLECELKTYSLATLRLYCDYIRACSACRRNLAREVAEKIAEAYGYASLEDAEKNMQL